MQGITNTIYIYYKKSGIISILAVLVFMILAGLWLIYCDIFYKNYRTEVYIPFVWPHSLRRILIQNLGGVIFCGLGFFYYARMLTHQGPLYIISPAGIMDCKFGFIPWRKIKKISGEIRDRFPSDAIMRIHLIDPEDHFKGKLRSYFGMRWISLSSKIMRYEYCDNETNQLT